MKKLNKLLSMTLAFVLMAGLLPMAMAFDADDLRIADVNVRVTQNNIAVDIDFMNYGTANPAEVTTGSIEIFIGIYDSFGYVDGATITMPPTYNYRNRYTKTFDASGYSEGYYDVYVDIGSDDMFAEFRIGGKTGSTYNFEDVLYGELNTIDDDEYYVFVDDIAEDEVPDGAIDKGEEVYVDLFSEKLVNERGFPIAAYSLDGGSKWKAGAPPETFEKLLNKEITLWVASQYDTATKKPKKGVAAAADGSAQAVPGATILKFPKIEKRPKMEKTFVNYAIVTEYYYGRVDDEAGWWVPVKEKGITNEKAEKMTDNEWAKIEEYINSLIIAPAINSKKTPDKGWFYFDAIPVRPTNPDAKPSKDVYLLRTLPVLEYSNTGTPTSIKPMSKQKKVTASGALQAPKLKPDYKKETIKPKAGMMVDVGQYIYDGSNYNYFPYKKGDTALKGLSFSDYLGSRETEGEAWICATDKKPCSMVQEIKFAPRAPLPATALSPDNGKLKLDKEYEVWDSGKKKYGGLPKITGNKIIGGDDLPGIRLKANAKVDKNGNYESGTFAASYDARLEITWGVLDETAAKKKNGVLTAKIEPN